MFRLPENNFYKALLWLATVILTFVYAWLGAKLMAPSSPFPVALIADIVWVAQGQTALPEKTPSFQWLEYQRICAELQKLASPIELIGGLKRPVHLLINSDAPEILRVDDSAIEIGIDLAEVQGQISKAVLKAWVLQNANTAISGSLLRTEVTTDALLAILRGRSLSDGGFLFFDPRNSLPTLNEPANWLAYAGSVEDVCQSRWSIPELKTLCEAHKEGVGELSSLSFRPLLAELIYHAYLDTSALKQNQFLNEWIAHIQKPELPEIPLDDFFEMKSLAQWRNRLREEVLAIVPHATLNLSQTIEKTFSLARLNDDQAPQIDLVSIKLGKEGSVREPIRAFNRTRHDFAAFSAVSVESKELISSSGHLRLPIDGDEALLHARMMAWQSCESPTLRQLLSVRVEAMRALVIKSCGSVVDLRPLRDGVPDLAKKNPEMTFVQLRIEGVRLALQKKVLLPSAKATEMIESSRAKSDKELDLFGLENARWRSDLAVFQPLGAIEAIEMYRTGQLQK
jgi:hypothetical protein